MTGRMWLFFFLMLVAKPALGENEHFKDRMNINAETQKTAYGHEFVPTKETVYGNIAVKSAEIYPKVIPPIKGPDDLKIVLELAESIPKAVKYLEDGKSLMTITKTNVDIVTHSHKENGPVPDPVHGKGHMKKTVTDSSVDRFTPDHKGDVVNRTPGYKGTTPSSDSGHTNSLVTTTQTIPGHKKRPEKTFVTGPCSATCGIGFQDIYRIKGCPENKSRCRVGVQECIVTPDCGWGKPVLNNEDSVLMDCSYKSQTERFTYIWRQLVQGERPQVLPYYKSVLAVPRSSEDVIYECNTIEKIRLIARVRYKFPSKAKPTEKKETEKSDYTELTYAIGSCLGIVTLAAIVYLVDFIYGKICLKKQKDIESKGEADERITISINGSDKKDPASDPGQHQTLGPETIDIEVRASSPVIVH